MKHWKCKSVSASGEKICTGPPEIFLDPHGKLKPGWTKIEDVEISDAVAPRDSTEWKKIKVHETVAAPGQAKPQKATKPKG